MTTTTKALLATLLPIACSIHCAEPASLSSYGVLVHCLDEYATPLAHVTLQHAGKALAQSTQLGPVTLTLNGHEGDVVALNVQCPADYELSSAPLNIKLRKFAQADKRAEYTVVCRATLRSVVVAVRADNGAHLPVRYLGEQVATTDAQGAAHVLLKVAPQESIELLLDTAARPGLRPRNPSQRFRVGERDEWLLLSQQFENEPQRPKLGRPSIINLRRR